MRPRHATLALTALLAMLALALAACSGGGPPTADATPEVAQTAEAPSTPAPTADAPPPPAPVPTPEPPPEVACANGVAVAEPEANPGLVADCVALLASRDALRGEASLDWGGDLAIGRWEGVAVGGEPPRVTGIDLRGKGLTGAIPRGLGGLTELTDLRLAGNRLTGAIPEWLGEVWTLSALILADNALTGGISRSIGRLRLDEVRLAGNALTGCVPSAFGDARGDAAYLGLPWCLRYDRLDAAGEAAGAGGWAILDADGEVLATWEGLRSEAATLRVHQTDAGGTSWASEFGAVSEGGLFEWRKASDCWVRYLVTDAPVRPPAGSGRWEFPVEWMAYAATGEGCTGVVGASAVLGADEAAPKVIPSTVIDSPVRHGPWLLVPLDWEGAIEEPVPHASGAAGGATGSDRPTVYTFDIAVAREFPLWREPATPAGWVFDRAEKGTESAPFDGYMAVYANERGYYAAEIIVSRITESPYQLDAFDGGGIISEARIIDGRWAWVRYVPPGRTVAIAPTKVRIFDEAANTVYIVYGFDRNFLGNNIEPTIEIARSLLPD